ncbi:unnamed protein product, partial [Mesorhabditis spiculigera]
MSVSSGDEQGGQPGKRRTAAPPIGPQRPRRSPPQNKPGAAAPARTGGPPPGEEDIASKCLQLGFKRFYVDVKQNARGRFVKMAEMGSSIPSRLTLSMSTAAALTEKIEELKQYSEAHPPDAENPYMEAKSITLTFDTRRYYLDLKQNQHGRFLRIAQTISAMTAHDNRATRNQVVVPDEGIGPLLETLREFIRDHGEGYMTETTSPDLPPSKSIRGVGGKTFFLDAGANDRGSFLRITEFKSASGQRQSVTIPSQTLVQIRDAINEALEKFESKATDGSAAHVDHEQMETAAN